MERVKPEHGSFLTNRAKSDPAKLHIAERLRRETTLPLKAIAGRVHLGTSKSANARLHAFMNPSDSTPSVQSWLRF